MVAVGLLGDPGVLRTTVAPELRADPVLARAMCHQRVAWWADQTPYVDAPADALLRSLLVAEG